MLFLITMYRHLDKSISHVQTDSSVSSLGCSLTLARHLPVYRLSRCSWVQQLLNSQVLRVSFLVAFLWPGGLCPLAAYTFCSFYVCRPKTMHFLQGLTLTEEILHCLAR